MSLSNDTLKSSPDENGNCHRVCSDPTSGKSSKHFRTYDSIRFSYCMNKYLDDRHNQPCITKSPATGRGTREWAMLLMNISQMVRKTAADFARTMTNETRLLSFNCLQYAILESVATFSKKRCKGEYVLCEDKIKNFEHFVDNSGRIAEMSSTSRSIRSNKNKCSKAKSYQLEGQPMKYHHQYCSNLAIPSSSQPFIITPSAPPYEEGPLPSYEQLFGIFSYQTMINNNNSNNNYHMDNPSPYSEFSCCCPPPYTEHDPRANTNSQPPQPEETGSWDLGEELDGPHCLLTAFIHFDFCQAQGQRIVCNLKGSCEQGHRYVLTTPTIHSLSRTFGERDEGEAGMLRVIANHECCSLCRHLPNMQHIFEQAQIDAAKSLT
ncbi:hypothetical protein BsWGS_16062 [Bradybaena similaris]